MSFDPMATIEAARRSLQPTTVQLPDGTVGYTPRAPDDCWPAATATVLQVPLSQLPRLRIDDRLRDGVAPEEVNRLVRRELETWLAARGWRMILHQQVPVDAERWIGIVPIEGWFQSHCLVMKRHKVLFGPAQEVQPAAALSRPVPELLKMAELMLSPGVRVAVQDPATAKRVAPPSWVWGADDVRAGFTFETLR